MAPESEHERVAAGIAECAAALQRLREPAHVAAIVQAASVVTSSLHAGGKLLAFGNGGSAADAAHLAAELVGRYLLERDALPALALTDNASTLTAVANDYGYEDVFARQVAALGSPGDVALAISTSGDSANVLAGVTRARARGIRTVGLTGASGGRLGPAVDLWIGVPAESTPRIQELHTVVVHLLCELVEREMAAPRPPSAPVR
jgi:D-sedoheptulose 7-phosphate isomerase